LLAASILTGNVKAAWMGREVEVDAACTYSSVFGSSHDEGKMAILATTAGKVHHARVDIELFV
jgi:hypothetical protein